MQARHASKIFRSKPWLLPSSGAKGLGSRVPTEKFRRGSAVGLSPVITPTPQTCTEGSSSTEQGKHAKTLNPRTIDNRIDAGMVGLNRFDHTRLVLHSLRFGKIHP